MDRDDDRTLPNPAANKSQAEGDRWTSEPDTVEERGRNRAFQGETGEGGGITNRPLSEERENQESVPDRGESRPGAHAGHGSERSTREKANDR